MRATMEPAPVGQTLRDVLVRLGPAGLADRLKDGPGFRLQLADGDAPAEPSEGNRRAFRIRGTGLVARTDIVSSAVLRALTQQVTVTNEGPGLSPAIREIDAFWLPTAISAGDCPRAAGYGGGLTDGYYPPRAYRPEEVTFGEARTWIPASRGFHRWWTGKGVFALESMEAGRSSHPNLPLMQAGWKTSQGEVGLWAALEWSARWKMEFGNGMDWLFTFRGGPRVKDIVLQPGETLRLPRVHLGVYAGGSEAASASLRRYVVEALAPDVQGRRPWAYAAYDHWFGLHEEISENLLMRQVDRAAELGLEFFVVDAGWYPAFGDKFWMGVGNWECCDEGKFPEGLEPIARHVASKGMGFGLWFEPERAYRNTHMHTKHPEWFWDTGTNSPHLNLALREAQDGLIEVLSGWITRLDIRWLRWDNNQAPGPFWDWADPTGKVQFGFVEGLYRVMDELLARHPGLMIDNCAGGGTRIDFGTLARCGTMVISDHAEDHHVCRVMQTGGARVLPGNFMNASLYVGREDAAHSASPLALLSRMAGAITLNGHIANWTASQARRVKKHIDGFKTYRHLLMKDFHPLTAYPRSEADWDVAEFADAAGGEAVILAYRVRGQTDAMRVFPKALLPEATYDVFDPFSSRRLKSRSGAELMSRGLRLSLRPESAAAWRLVPAQNRGGG